MNQVAEQIENKFNWYSVRVISGKELLAKENILFEADLAIKYLELSVKTGKATLNQKNYLAQAYHKSGDSKKARKILNDVISSHPRTSHIVEDLNDIDEATTLLKKY